MSVQHFSALVLFCNDLRINDHEPLTRALKEKNVIPCYYAGFDKEYKKVSLEWRRKAVDDLKKSLKQIYALHLLEKDSFDGLIELIEKKNISACYMHAYYAGHQKKIYDFLKMYCEKKNLSFYSYDGCTIINPLNLKNKSDTEYRVFTPFYKEVRKTLLVFSLHAWKKVEGGEEDAHEKSLLFLRKKGKNYEQNRNTPCLDGTSGLSQYFACGQISPLRVIHNTIKHMQQHDLDTAGCECFIKEVIWRDFAYYCLHYYPDLQTKPVNKNFEKFPWQDNHELFEKWKYGLTGYPIVDAGMRELLTTGRMHNRVRMIVASFLIKDLLISWQKGERWFWEHLVDADQASNSFNWQWVAGCGFDAAPYFRIFNPELQSKKFDPDGIYIKQYVDELKKLDAEYIHAPHLAPSIVLKNADIEIGKTYPFPCVDHKEASKKALNYFKNL